MTNTTAFAVLTKACQGLALQAGAEQPGPTLDALTAAESLLAEWLLVEPTTDPVAIAWKLRRLADMAETGTVPAAAGHAGRVAAELGAALTGLSHDR
ncbi:MAG: hypothetical protein H7840_15470 [Alphaproteobacteria bacterium]